MGRWWSFSDETVDTVSQEFDLQLLGVDFFLSPLTERERQELISDVCQGQKSLMSHLSSIENRLLPPTRISEQHEAKSIKGLMHIQKFAW